MNHCIKFFGTILDFVNHSLISFTWCNSAPISRQDHCIVHTSSANCELNARYVITDQVVARALEPLGILACLVAQHEPFAWGKTVDGAVFHADVLEQIARMAVHCRSLDLNEHGVPDYLLRKHYEPKYGPKPYYGQSSNNQ